MMKEIKLLRIATEASAACAAAKHAVNLHTVTPDVWHKLCEQADAAWREYDDYLKHGGKKPR